MTYSTQGGENKTSNNLTYGNTHGEVRFGHLHAANPQTLGSDVTSGVMLQAFDSNHYLTLDNTGKRKGWTTSVTPGSHNIVCGVNVPDGMTPEQFNAFFCVAQNGDIVLKSERGRIRLIAQNIDLVAEGPSSSGSGYVNINSNQGVNIDTGYLSLVAKQGIKIITPRNMQLVANTSLNLISSFIQNFTSATSNSVVPHYRMLPQLAHIVGGNVTANGLNTPYEAVTQRKDFGTGVSEFPLSTSRGGSTLGSIGSIIGGAVGGPIGSVVGGFIGGFL